MKAKVVRADRSPMNALRWMLTLSCGHEVWVTSASKPVRRLAECYVCERK